MNEPKTTEPTGTAVRSSDGLGCWFYAKYGFSIVTGQCVGRTRNGEYLLRFRWGNPYRTTQLVDEADVLNETTDPRWLSRLVRIFKSAKHPNRRALPPRRGRGWSAKGTLEMNTTIERTAEAGLAAATGSGFFASYEPDPIGVMLGTGYNRFATADGMNGLAKITGDRLDVLAVVASKAGEGQFRRFIASAKLTFKIVAVWEDWNPIVGEALKRYGFRPATCTEADGEVNHGWQWESQNAAGELQSPPNNQK